jgi:hypothetical protein
VQSQEGPWPGTRVESGWEAATTLRPPFQRRGWPGEPRENRAVLTRSTLSGLRARAGRAGQQVPGRPGVVEESKVYRGDGGLGVRNRSAAPPGLFSALAARPANQLLCRTAWHRILAQPVCACAGIFREAGRRMGCFVLLRRRARLRRSTRKCGNEGFFKEPTVLCTAHETERRGRRHEDSSSRGHGWWWFSAAVPQPRLSGERPHAGLPAGPRQGKRISGDSRWVLNRARDGNSRRRVRGAGRCWVLLAGE